VSFKGIDHSKISRDLAKIEKSIKAAGQRAAHKAAHGAKALLVQRSPKDLGQLKASWRVGSGKGGSEGVELFNDAPHAGIVEHGARPHPVSAEGRLAIREWVIRHFGFVGTKKRGTRRLVSKNQVTVSGKIRGIGTRKASLRDEEMNAQIDKIVEGIIHKLETKGQAPTYFVRDSLEDIEAILKVELASELAKVDRKVR
jgi:hypothetical protein